MRLTMITFAAALASNMLAATPAVVAQSNQTVNRTPLAPDAAGDAEAANAAAAEPLTPEAINAADLGELLLAAEAPEAEPLEPRETFDGETIEVAEAPAAPDAAVVKLQVLLDRAASSPGVIDGFDGENVSKAIYAFETMRGLPADGELDRDVIAALDQQDAIVGTYTVTAEDVSAVTGPTPEDYAEKAQQEFLGYETVAEGIAERFHMDIDLLNALNRQSGFNEGDVVFVTAYGPDTAGEVAYIEADKGLRQVRAYDQAGTLLAAYPATIGSDDNPSPSGTHVVEGIAPMPDYTYNPEINFQQGDNTDVLRIPPGPNGPVGTMWIDLSEPTFGIHGTPEPSQIDKTASHGCVRLTNWDASELAAMVEPGVTVEFVG
jgi:lipoprotein-anchoring transpeptidase ErfK/SrfK